MFLMEIISPREILIREIMFATDSSQQQQERCLWSWLLPYTNATASATNHDANTKDTTTTTPRRSVQPTTAGPGEVGIPPCTGCARHPFSRRATVPWSWWVIGPIRIRLTWKNKWTTLSEPCNIVNNNKSFFTSRRTVSRI